ncbi:hypothetical protein VNO78_00819 [Psophocarpus tetragonolobus]|uniref:Uncharacterized protein n=1 Tax=Psophocarpus tetragonolobus TaxID=3891 RepID=A0AAN9SXG1_PSOTE
MSFVMVRAGWTHASFRFHSSKRRRRETTNIVKAWCFSTYTPRKSHHTRNISFHFLEIETGRVFTVTLAE